MHNAFFTEMRRAGTRYRKGKSPEKTPHLDRFGIAPPYSQGQSFAFRFWAIADRYNSDAIVVDELPSGEEVSVMLETFAQAGIRHILIRDCDVAISAALIDSGCIPVGRSRIVRQGPDIYTSDKDTIAGIILKNTLCV